LGRIGSHWLLLEPLKRSHVHEIIVNSKISNNPAFTFHQQLSREQLDRLIDNIIDWTAVSPRSLLYVLHMLQRISEPLIESIKTQVGLNDLFKDLYNFIQKTLSLRMYLGPVSKISEQELTEDERGAYIELCVLAWQGKHLERHFTLSNGTAAMIYLKASTFLIRKLRAILS